MPVSTTTAVLDALQNVIAPMVERDGGELYVVNVTDAEVSVHLAGLCSGCPGFTLTTTRFIEPLLLKLTPGSKFTFTNGALIPKQARRIHGLIRQ